METNSVPKTNDSTAIKQWLKHGDISTLAKKHSVSKQYVSLILNPNSEKMNVVIFKSALKLAEKNKKDFKENQERLQSLAS